MKNPIVVGAAVLLLAAVARAEDRPASARDTATATSSGDARDGGAKVEKPSSKGERSKKAHGKAERDARGGEKQQAAKPCEETKPCAIE